MNPNTDKSYAVLYVKIVSPKQVIFEGSALSVSSINSGGRFDILPKHANFITLIENNPILIMTPNKQQLTFRFPLAIIYNLKNQVNIYTDIQLQLN